MDEVIVVLTNLPEREAALKLARDLVTRKLAACVNVLAECSSVYRWQGRLDEAREVPVLIKTRAALYSEVESAIREQHPYELPEVVAVPVVHGFSGYLEWVARETTDAIR